MARTGEQRLSMSVNKIKREDPILYNCPQGWESHQMYSNKFSLVVAPIFLIIGFLMLYLGSASTSPKKSLGIVFSFFFIGFGLLLLVALIWSNIDKKDTWHKRLPYDIKLYDRFNYSLKEMLKNKQYRFSFKNFFGFNTVMDRKTGKKYGMLYIISTWK